MAPKHTNPVKNRRRKKRRTEDFSSDSDSSDSDSGSNSGSRSPVREQEQPVSTNTITKEAININDIDIQSDAEDEPRVAESSVIPAETQQKLDSIKFTNTEKETLAEANETILRDRKELESEFLAYMATTFSEDLDELRKKPDFTEKSLVILAKTLQSGSNMFDSGALQALLNQQ